MLSTKKLVKFSWSVVLISLSWYVLNTFTLSSSFLNLAVSKARSRPSGDAVVEFDEFGGLPQLENTYRAIGRASTIVAIRSANATILSYTTNNSTSIQLPIGAQSLNQLNNPWQFLLISGLAGDARCVVRHAKQIVLKYTMEFDAVPTGKFIAHEVGKFLQEYTVKGGLRPLACHIFIADSFVEKSLYEVDAAGNVAEIWAGVAGSNMVDGRDILVGHLHGSAITSIEKAIEIAESVLECAGSERRKLLDILNTAADTDEFPKESVRSVHFTLFDKE